MRILVVEDEVQLAEAVARGLRREGMAVDVATDGDEGYRKAALTRYDVVVLDRDLPGMSGDEICRRLTDEGVLTRVMMLTASGTVEDKVTGLALGADDYLAKPFSPNELVARVRALLRRAQRAAGPRARTPTYGPIVIDTDRHIVSLDGRDVSLTAKEFLLLEYLMQHRGRVLSRDVLLTDVWGYRYTGGTRTVDVHVRRLREKLPVLGDALVTVKQFGYKLLDQAPATST
jgi:DNA-binding response OmpR family regulator